MTCLCSERWLLFLPALTLILIGCERQGEVDNRLLGSSKDIVLSDVQSVAHILVNQEAVAQSAGVLEIDIVSINNPEHTPFALALTLEDSVVAGEDSILAHSAISVFPPDKPGRFTVRLFDEYDAEHGANLHLVVQLLPITPGIELTPLEIRIAPVVWE